VRISAALPPGVHALLFESAARRRRLETGLAARLEAAGFSEVVLPVLDYLEPYAPLLGSGRGRSGGSERYHLLDRDGELLALRGDFTPMLARLLAPRLPFLPRPLRLYYRGDVVRLEEERPGGQREFYQVGAELLGLRGERAERAMLRLCLELLAGGGAGESVAATGTVGAEPSLHVVLSFAGALDGPLLAARGADPLALALAIERRERAAVRRAAPELLAVVEQGVPERPEDLGARAGRRLARLLALRDDLARRFPAARLVVDLAEFARHTLHPRLTAAAADPTGAASPPAMAYYDGLVFRAYVGRSAQPVASGGRYDRLFRALGAEIPAVGFSLGLDRWLAAVEQASTETPPVEEQSTRPPLPCGRGARGEGDRVDAVKVETTPAPAQRERSQPTKRALRRSA
jgi:ATP phosphoribosyltransferase regulatory subunit